MTNIVQEETHTTSQLVLLLSPIYHRRKYGKFGPVVYSISDAVLVLV